MEDELKNRSALLEKILPKLFKCGSLPNENLIRNILIHQNLASNPAKISSPKTIKVNVENTFEKFSPGVEIEQNQSTQKCPLSQATIKVPWTGECGHTFEEKFILDYLRLKDASCPIHGCKKSLVKKMPR